MKEIKFRAWDIKEQHMLSSWGLREIIEVFTRSNELDYWDDYIWLQFTGLKDKNGVEIYEADIVQVEIMSGGNWIVSKGTEVIEWVRGGFSRVYGERNMPVWWLDEDTQRFEVIGNIYENPELVK